MGGWGAISSSSALFALPHSAIHLPPVNFPQGGVDSGISAVALLPQGRASCVEWPSAAAYLVPPRSHISEIEGEGVEWHLPAAPVAAGAGLGVLSASICSMRVGCGKGLFAVPVGQYHSRALIPPPLPLLLAASIAMPCHWQCTQTPHTHTYIHTYIPTQYYSPTPLQTTLQYPRHC